MSPFPTRRSSSLLPLTNSLSSSSPSSYPPSPLSAPITHQPFSSTSSTTNKLLNPTIAEGEVKKGVIGGVGIGWREEEAVRKGLEERFSTRSNNSDPSTSQLLAAYSLGANERLLSKLVDRNKSDESTLPPLQPIAINDQNWTLYLADARFFTTYLHFFTLSLAIGSTSSVLEKFLFGEGQMLLRSFENGYEGLRRIGEGIEFGVKGLIAEGLAITATQHTSLANVLPSSWPPLPPKPSSFQSAFSSTFKMTSTRLLPPISPPPSFVSTLNKLKSKKKKDRDGLTGLTVLERVVVGGGEVDTWCEEWWGETLGVEVRWEDCVEMCEECFWVATILYGASTRPGDESSIGMDFFSMQSVAALIFLPTLLETLSDNRCRSLLLQGYFRSMMAFGVQNGRPSMFVAANLVPPPSAPTPGPMSPTIISPRPSLSLTSPPPASPLSSPPTSRSSSPVPVLTLSTPPASSPRIGGGKIKPSPLRSSSNSARGVKRSHGNKWFEIMDIALGHGDGWVILVIRSLAYAATHFGTAKPGDWTSSLAGTGLIDGNIFVRAAQLTLLTPPLSPWNHSPRPTALSRSLKGKQKAFEVDPADPDTVTVVVGDVLENQKYGTEVSPVDGVDTREVIWERGGGKWEEAKREEDETEEGERELMA